MNLARNVHGRDGISVRIWRLLQVDTGVDLSRMLTCIPKDSL